MSAPKKIRGRKFSSRPKLNPPEPLKYTGTVSGICSVMSVPSPMRLLSSPPLAVMTFRASPFTSMEETSPSLAMRTTSVKETSSEPPRPGTTMKKIEATATIIRR